MKKLILLLIINTICSHNILYANISDDINQELLDSNRQPYILDVHYSNWEDDVEPFNDYNQGVNVKYTGEVLRLPVLDEHINNKKVQSVGIYANDVQQHEYIRSKIQNRDHSFEMPASDVELYVTFENFM